MKKFQHKGLLTLGGGAVIAVCVLAAMSSHTRNAATTSESKSAGPAPALSVAVEKPQMEKLAHTLSVNGNVVAWQESSIGADTNGLRLSEVRVNVGDRVERGQVLAVFESQTVQAEFA